MKYLYITLIAAASSILFSCEQEKTNYSLDLSTSSLGWKGTETPDYFHTGTLKFKDGNIVMQGDQLVSGSFKIDMNSIMPNDADLPEKKKLKLAEHLKDTSFFFVSKFPDVLVTVGGYSKGKLLTTLTVLGQEIKQEIPVKLKSKGNDLTITGNFNVDFSSLKIEGMQPEQGSSDHIQEVIDYDLKLILKK